MQLIDTVAISLTHREPMWEVKDLNTNQIKGQYNYRTLQRSGFRVDCLPKVGTEYLEARVDGHVVPFYVTAIPGGSFTREGATAALEYKMGVRGIYLLTDDGGKSYYTPPISSRKVRKVEVWSSDLLTRVTKEVIHYFYKIYPDRIEKWEVIHGSITRWGKDGKPYQWGEGGEFNDNFMDKGFMSQ